MYVCICKSITDRDIREAVSSGARSLKDLQRELGVASDCGKCATCAQEMLSEARSEQVGSPRLQAA